MDPVGLMVMALREQPVEDWVHGVNIVIMELILVGPPCGQLLEGDRGASHGPNEAPERAAAGILRCWRRGLAAVSFAASGFVRGVVVHESEFVGRVGIGDCGVVGCWRRYDHHRERHSCPTRLATTTRD